MSVRLILFHYLVMTSGLLWPGMYVSAESKISDDEIKVPSFYRFIDERARDLTWRDERQRIGVEHRSVLYAGFRKVQPISLTKDGSVTLAHLVSPERLHPDASGIWVIAHGPRGSFDTYTDVPAGGTDESFGSNLVRIAPDNQLPEDLPRIRVYAREKFPDAYVSRRLVIPEYARLDFGIGRDETLKRSEKKSMRFEIVIEYRNAQETIFSEVLAPVSSGPLQEGEVSPDTDDHLAWKDYSLDLTRYEGETARFTFRTTILTDDELSEQDRIHNVPLWANPILFAGTPSRSEDMPNLIIISLDTLRADHMGIYGYEKKTTPNIDRFAENAIVFEKCISPTSWTTPAHVSLFTGLNPAEHGAGGHPKLRLREGAVTLAELARQAGYLTVAFTDGAAVAGHTGLVQGFDQYGDNVTGAFMTQGTSEDQFQRATKWLGSHKKYPFFLFFHTYEIHTPYDPPSPFLEQFKTGSKNSTLGLLKRPGDIRESIGLYDGGIAYTDSVMGKFFDWLLENNLLENSIILLVSDHGEEFGEHKGVTHLSTLYDEVVHVPFILRLPGANPPAGRVERMIALQDGFATALELLDIPYHDLLDSVSVLPLLPGSAATSTYDRSFVDGILYSSTLNRLTLSRRTKDAKYIALATLNEGDSALTDLISQGITSLNVILGLATLDALENSMHPPGILEEYYDLSNDPRESLNIAPVYREKTLKTRNALRARLDLFSETYKKFPSDHAPTLWPITVELREELEAMGYLN